jgi:hypothetical protein
MHKAALVIALVLAISDCSEADSSAQAKQVKTQAKLVC